MYGYVYINIRCTYLIVRVLMRSGAKHGKMWALGEKKISASAPPQFKFCSCRRLSFIIF